MTMVILEAQSCYLILQMELVNLFGLMPAVGLVTILRLKTILGIVTVVGLLTILWLVTLLGTLTDCLRMETIFGL